MKMNNRKLSSVHRRFLVLAVFFASLISLFARAMDMQTIHQAFFKQQGVARHVRVLEIAAHRGDVYDRYGEPLAMSKRVDSVWADPGQLNNSGDALVKLTKALSLDLQSLKQRIKKNQGLEFMYLRRHVDPDTARQVRELAIPGVFLQPEYKRYYPAGEVTSHLLGFTNVDDHGQEGIELSYDDWLSGETGSKKVIRDRLGRIVEDVAGLKTAHPGKNLTLSIDKRVQYLAYRALKAAVKNNKAAGGTAVMIDVKTGEVLAMVNQPSFNPNDRSQLKPGVYRNRAVTDVFEPGSTSKPFTIAAALDSGRWHPRDNVHTEPGYFKVLGNMIRDERNYGKLDLGGILLKSSKVGSSKVALSLDEQQHIGMYQKMGFGELTGSGFPGEQSGHLSIGDINDFERATMSFGYSISVTALQLARAYAAIANDGIILPVSLLKVDHEEPGVRVMTASTAHALKLMLEPVVSRQGTAAQAHVANYRVAGKTGTVHKFIAGGYAEHRYISLFAGMAPVENTRLALVVMVDEPSAGKHFGGQVAAPVFAEIMTGSLRLLNITPDDLKMAQRAAIGDRA